MKTRLLAPDLARGMMLLFIALANVSLYLWGGEAGYYSQHPTGEGLLSTYLVSGVILFIDGSVYPMFAFLFGYGITLFATSRLAKGLPLKEVNLMLLRRHIWLLIFGALHAILLFAGDILGAYALTGLVLAPLLVRATERTVRIILWSLGGIIAGTMILGAIGLVLLQLLVPPQFLDFQSGVEGDIPSIAFLMNGISNYPLAMLSRFGLWIASSISSLPTLIVPFTVLLGGYAARFNWLEGLSKSFRLKPVACWGISVGVIASLPLALHHLVLWELNSLNLISFQLFSQLFGIANGIGYIALFALLSRRSGFLIDAISAIGKRSLSFYLFQSIVFAPLLAAWGFGIGSRIDSATAYLIAASVWIFSLIFAILLERNNTSGPAEHILRKLTYGKQV